MQKAHLKDALFIIDGSSFLYRAYYAIKPLHAPDGRPVQAVYGFCRMIKKLIDRFDPQTMVLVFDSPGKTTRHEIYQGYKEKRQSPPSDLVDQKDLILEFAGAINLTVLIEPGIEADDLMYSIALEARSDGLKSVVVSSDKDMRQFVGDDIIIFDPFKDLFLDVPILEQEYEFPVEKIPFYFALVGDSSDNIPGVRGVGHKKATELVKKFENLDDLYSNIEFISGSLQKNLREGRDNAYMSYELFLLREYPIDLSIKDTYFNSRHWPQAQAFFEKLNFRTLLKAMPHTEHDFIPLSKRKNLIFIPVTTKKQLEEVAKLIKKQGWCALDTETTGVNPLENEMIGISICCQPGTAYYIPFGHTTGKQLDKSAVIKALKPLLQDPTIKKVMHNAKFDWCVLYASGITLKGLVLDTMVAASLLLLNGQRYSLKSLSEYYLGDRMMTYDMVVKRGNYKSFDEVPLDLATEYAASDAHQTALLAPLIEEDLKKNEPLWALYNDIEHPLIEVLCSMEAAGIYVDIHVLAEIDKEVVKDLARLREAIIDMVGTQYKNINLNSPKQLEELLFEHLKLAPIKKTAGRASYSTDQAVLQELARVHPVPSLIVKYRELFKLKSTYIDALPQYINPQTGRIHTTFNQTAVATGRLSSSDPNLQNIPAGTTMEDKSVREAFKPTPGYRFISADYSQIELRVLAFLSQDEALMSAFTQGYDIHAETAARLFDVPLAKVTHEQRQIGKRINFSILYGLTPYGLSRSLDISYRDAQDYILKYFQQYPKVRAWMDRVVDFAQQHGYVQTYWGRRRYVPGIYERNKNVYEAARRAAINTVAQGTAAEIMKQGMIRLYQSLQEHMIDGEILIQIHDELLVMVKEEQIEESLAIIQSALDGVTHWNVPLEISLRIGKNWQEVTK